MGAKARIQIQRLFGAIAVIAAVLLVIFAPLDVPWWTRVLVLVVGGAIGIDQAWRRIPAFDLFGRIRWRLPHVKGKKRCAITFDDGPSPDTEKVLNILKDKGVKATFFVVGANALRYPELVRRAFAEGHAIGLHGYTHTDLINANEEQARAQLNRCRDTLSSLGVNVSSIYRAPHGYKSRAVLKLARAQGLEVWAWSRGVWDTDRPPPYVLVQRATRLARDGMVLLLHDGHNDEATPDISPMVTALPDIIECLKKRGFEFVRLTDI